MREALVEAVVFKPPAGQGALPGGDEADAEDAIDAPAFGELAIANWLIETHRADLRYVSEWGKWYVFGGTRWEPDRKGYAFSRARKFCLEAAAACEKESRKETLTSAKTVAGVDKLALNDGRLILLPEEMDRDPWLLNTPGGVIDLRTGKLRPHRAKDYMSKSTSVPLDANCLTPLWDTFLEKITDGDTDLAGFLQRIAGYALTGVINEEALFFLFGTGGNGKGVYTTTISGCLGDYYCTAPIEILIEAPYERHPADLARLKGARLVTLNETEENKRWSESKIKLLTGGDPVPARFMHKNPFEYVPQFKLVISGNHKPALRSVNEAVRRRFNLVPFNVTIPDGSERDPELKGKLKAEYPGILAWMVRGCLDWQENGLRAAGSRDRRDR